MILSLIAAASENNVIGKAGTLPWHLPADFQYFKQVTTGKPIIMGRKTFESIGRPLPKRRNIIVTRNASFTAEGCDVVHSVEEAVKLAEQDGEEVVVIGGEEIYKLALPLANRIHLTRVHATIEDGDAFFPEISLDEWKEVSHAEHPADGENAFAFTIIVYERK